MSRRDGRGAIIPTNRWAASMMARAEQVLTGMLAGAGDHTRERLFRLQVRVSLQRALTPAEIAALPGWFNEAPAVDPLGGPVAILRETEPGPLSTRPCRRPVHQPLPLAEARSGTQDRDLWIPADCGACPSCLARAS